MYDIGSLLDFDCRAAGISVQKSAILHKDARQGVIGGLPSEAGQLTAYYYASSVYSKLVG